MKAIPLYFILSLLCTHLLLGQDGSAAERFNRSGLIKHEFGDENGAIADYAKAIELDSKNARAFHFRGLSQYFFGDKDGSCIDWSKARELGYANA